MGYHEIDINDNLVHYIDNNKDVVHAGVGYSHIRLCSSVYEVAVRNLTLLLHFSFSTSGLMIHCISPVSIEKPKSQTTTVKC